MDVSFSLFNVLSLGLLQRFHNISRGRDAKFYLECGDRRLGLRWLNTVLRAVSGNSRDGACFKLDK